VLVLTAQCERSVMGFLEEELEQVKTVCEKRIGDSRLVQCVKDLVRVEIVKTRFRTVTIVLHFPNDYPDVHVLTELHSKTLSKVFLDRLTNVCDEEAKKYLGERQVMRIVEFLNKFLTENPLCSCSEEISSLKRQCMKPQDEIKLNQSNAFIQFQVNEGSYFYRFKIFMPDDYPDSQVTIESIDSNFPTGIIKILQANAHEMARRCVEAPLNQKGIDTRNNPFQIKPSLEVAAVFLVENVHRFPNEKCPVCGQICFPKDPEDIIHEENKKLHIERIYCGHLYHLNCLFRHMKTPPFTGGKKCLACEERIFHDKYKISPELAEARWAHRQARNRELQDVVDFLA